MFECLLVSNRYVIGNSFRLTYERLMVKPVLITVQRYQSHTVELRVTRRVKIPVKPTNPLLYLIISVVIRWCGPCLWPIFEPLATALKPTRH